MWFELISRNKTIPWLMDSNVSALSVVTVVSVITVVSVVTVFLLLLLTRKEKKFLQNVIDRPIRMHEVFLHRTKVLNPVHFNTFYAIIKYKSVLDFDIKKKNIYLVCPIWLPLFFLYCNSLHYHLHPSSILFRGSNPQPLGYEPFALTTRPCLLAKTLILYKVT